MKLCVEKFFVCGSIRLTHQVVRYCGVCCVKYKPNADLDPLDQDID